MSLVKNRTLLMDFMTLFFSGLGHERGRASSSSCVGPHHPCNGVCVGSFLKTSRNHCLLDGGTTRSSSRVAPSRLASMGVSSASYLNRHLHHANSQEKLSASFTRVAKSWVPKYMLANPSGSKTRASLSSHV